MSSAPKAAPHLRALTGLRFVAAFWVLVFHTMPRAALPAPLRALAAGGFLGVGLFFVLSGFILAHVYGARAVTGTLSARQFWRARFARVYPAYCFALLFAIPLLAHFVRTTGTPRGATLAGICVANVTMLQAWVPGWGCVWNCPGWSLSAEAFFYLAFPLVAPWVLRQQGDRLWWIAGVCVAALVAVGMLLGNTAEEVPFRSVYEGAYLTAWTPLVRLPEFVLGICAARLASRPDGYIRLPAWVTLAATVVLAAIVVVSEGWSYGLLRVAAVTVPVAVLIVSLASPSGTSVLASRALVRLGNASYSLYLLHAVAHSYFLAVANRVVSREWAPGWTAFVVYSLMTVALAIVVHDWLELPMRRALRPTAERVSSAAAAW